MPVKSTIQTLSEENYLKIIYRHTIDGMDKISLTAIAESLNNNPASVVDMLKKLVEKNLIQYEKSTGVKLTENGKKIAIEILRKHRLWEVFLHEKLGYAWDEVHDIAEQLEHIKDESLSDRLDQFLGFPTYDPHGDPIPKSNGEMAIISKTTLADVADSHNCQVVAVKDTSALFLQYLNKLEIGIGTEIEVLERIPFDNSIVIHIGKNNKTTVSKVFAENLLVSR